MKKNISILTFVALVVGVLLGIYLPQLAANISFIGKLYTDFLKIMIVPVVFTSISLSIYNSKGEKNNLVLRSILMFIIMFVATFLLTSLLVVIIDPAKNFIFNPIEKEVDPTEITIISILSNLIPSSLTNLVTGKNLFIVIVIAYLTGYVLARVNNSTKIISGIEKVRDFLFKVLEYVTYITPLAVIALISNAVVNNGTEVISAGFKYIGTSLICCIITVFVIMILPVWLIAKVNPIDYIKRVSRIWMITITTCSSNATLPYTMKVCNQQFGVPENITNVVVPLGCTIHMCGGAVSFSLLGLFCCKLFNVPVSILTYLYMIASALLINMSAPGIPGGGVIIGATYLQLLGVPYENFIGLYSGMYKVLDMFYTTLNVTGDISANVIINANKD